MDSASFFHEFVPGHPLGRHEPVSDTFFNDLRDLLAAIHQRGVAYVDLYLAHEWDPEVTVADVAGVFEELVAEGKIGAYGLSEVYDYYLERHQRNSFDDNGGTILGMVRYGTGYNNAFWNGSYITFGDAHPWAGANFMRYARAVHRALKRAARRAVSLAYAQAA